MTKMIVNDETKKMNNMRSILFCCW